MRFLLTLLLGILLGASGWHLYLKHLAPPPPPTAARFPVDRKLTNRSGLVISARLTGRNSTHVQLVRLDDNSSFVYPISSLSDEDQRFVREFPETHLTPHTTSAPATITTSRLPEAVRLTNQRADLEHQIGILKLELAKQDDPNQRLPKDEVRRRIDEMRNQIISIDQQLKELEFRSRQ